ncbi:NADPH-dependent F420 reductase [Occultella kanbiaonis]|uniref:NADPH-dependent F420 reductase n=1 Tax=Occultella kanbiaonis TaxID=2675754 RepID=UPI0012B9D3A3|nr:diguanylate cyclase [Occultella kanbiaonis]
MSTISIVGKGNMGTAIASIVTAGGNDVEFVDRDTQDINGDIVILAVPVHAQAEIVATHGAKLAGRTVVDISNPLNFETFDSLTVPADSSAAQQLAAQLPDATILKAFNTNFAATLSSRTVGGVPTTVLIAGDDDAAKGALNAVLTAGGVKAVDAGSLKRARELESIGFLQLTLAASEKISWTAGFSLHA